MDYQQNYQQKLLKKHRLMNKYSAVVYGTNKWVIN